MINIVYAFCPYYETFHLIFPKTNNARYTVIFVSCQMLVISFQKWLCYNQATERRRIMKKWYLGGAWLLLVLIVTQFVTPAQTNQNHLHQEAMIIEDSSNEIATASGTLDPNLLPAITLEGYYYTNPNYETYIKVLNKQVPLVIKQIDLNYSKGITIQPKYIVIHETNNYSVGADANAHYRYWSSNPTAEASTHFVVDNKEIYQMLELDQAAWHVGDRPGYSDINNFNSIGIEIAVNADGNYQEARQNAIQLTINLMNHLGMNISQLKRHYDATGKWCPTIMLENPHLWDDFVYQVSLGLNQ